MSDSTVILHQHHVTIAHLWYDELPPTQPVDLLQYMQNLSPPASRSTHDFYTLVNNLARTQSELEGALDKGTRYEIRRADRSDHLSYLHWLNPGPQEQRDFVAFYNRFSDSKRLAPAHVPTIEAYAAAGRLRLSRCTGPHRAAETWHSYVVAGSWARLLHSASHFRGFEAGLRAQAGRANRWLHWQDFLRLKSDGFVFYDMGGWHDGTQSVLLAINRFKEGFGGEIVRMYRGTRALTLRGRVYLSLRRAAGRR